MDLKENTHLYSLHELGRVALAPLRFMAKTGRDYHNSIFSPFYFTPFGRTMAAGFELIERITRRYSKPEFGITNANIKGKQQEVIEKIVMEKPFCNLIRFKCGSRRKAPKLLIVAPLSGHHATLLRGTVKGLLPHANIWITDWLDARDVPLTEGKFDLDDYIDYVIEFVNFLGNDVHLLAVCQPSVPVLAAASIMAAEDSPNQPLSMTLMGGPIDARENPTEVNKLAMNHPIEWFEQNVVTRVPFNHAGFMRRVYPGFMQLTGFMQMNLDRHIGEHVKLFQHLVDGDGDSALAHKKFYNEYLSVLDLPAEFYLQTVQTVFQDFSLPKGKMKSKGRKVDPKAITKTALLTIEGEKDDISGVGQTKAAQKLCANLPEHMKKHHLQMGVGHYGIFNGRKYRELIAPMIAEFINQHDK
jgi:poly(3-hydroxybutyrate) depolymerase